MIDATRILQDLKHQATEFGRDERFAGLRDTAGKLRTRLAEDKHAKTLAAGAGGLLLLGLLGSKGGRKMIGNVAQTGAVAALGALAYRAWTNRGAGADPAPAELKKSGFLLESEHDPEFSSAVIHAMLGAAAADGALDVLERGAVEEALKKAGASPEDLRALIGEMNENERFTIIERGARSPNHASEIFAAAVVAAGELNEAESQFLDRLADRLRIHPTHAAEIRAQAA